MGADDGSAAASPTAPTSGGGPPNSVERLKERLREAARRREKLVERQRGGISRLRALHQELGEAVDAGVSAENGDPVAVNGEAGGNDDSDGVRDELKRLQVQVRRQLEVSERASERISVGCLVLISTVLYVVQAEKASVEGLDVSEPACLTESSTEEVAVAVNGKRKRDDASEEDKPPSPRETSEATHLSPLQPVDLMCKAP